MEHMICIFSTCDVPSGKWLVELRRVIKHRYKICYMLYIPRV